MIFGVSPLAYVSLSSHNCALLKSNSLTRPSRVLSRDACRFAAKDIPLYVSLDPSQEEIRLLVVHPGQDSTDIVCSLQEVSLLKHPKFTALSYHWKAPTFQFHTSRWTFRGLLHYVCQHLNIDLPEIPILVDGQRFFVTPNLDAALHHLRKPDAPLKIWVDAICINQANNKEKESQIPLMSKIYGQAETTYLWLGPAAEDSDTAMDFITFSTGISMLDKINTLSPPFSALHAFYSRTWWTRMWVIQEVLLSRKAIFVCGQKQVPLHIFCQLASKEFAFANQWKSDSISRTGSRAIDAPARPSRWIFIPMGLPFYHFFLLRYHEQIQMLNMDLPRNNSSSKNLLILTPMIFTTRSNFKSTLPRDRIYGLLAIAPPIFKAAIDVDYSGQKTDGDVFKEFMVLVLKTSNTLMPLTLVEGGSTMLGLPSWAIDFSKVNITWRTLQSLSRCSFCASGTNLDWERLIHPVGSILQTAIKAANLGLYYTLWPPSYKGCSTSCASFSDHDNTLILRGIFFDTISFAKPVGNLPEFPSPSCFLRFEMGPLPYRWQVLHRIIPDTCRHWEQAVKLHCPYNPYYAPQGRYEAFLRTLTVNQFEYSGNALGVPLAYDIVIGRKPPSFSPWTQDKMNMMLGTFIGTVADTLNNRAFIITERGFLGLAPETAREGDAVCIFQGGEAPFVVRPKGEDHWEFVGECYVHGIMNGEVVKEAKREDVKMFRLV